MGGRWWGQSKSNADAGPSEADRCATPFLDAAIAGSSEAALAMFNCCEDSITNGVSLGGIGPKHHLWDDAVSEAQVNMLANFRYIIKDEQPCGWMHGVAKNTAQNVRRKQQRREKREGRMTQDLKNSANVEGIGVDPADAFDRGEVAAQRGRIATAVWEQVSDEDRELLGWRNVEGLGIGEIAERLFLSYSGAKARIDNAQQRAAAVAWRMMDDEDGDR